MLALSKNGKMQDINNATMENKKTVKDNLVTLISKIGEKITLRRSDYIGEDNCLNFSFADISSLLYCIPTYSPQSAVQSSLKVLLFKDCFSPSVISLIRFFNSRGLCTLYLPRMKST